MNWLKGNLPSGELTVCNGKSPFLIGKPSINGPFSIAMLVHQRVTGKCSIALLNKQRVTGNSRETYFFRKV